MEAICSGKKGSVNDTTTSQTVYDDTHDTRQPPEGVWWPYTDASGDPLPYYTHTAYQKFCADIWASNLRESLRHYDGRFSYDGPAVRVTYIGDVNCETRVPCTHDNLGLSYIVYPRVQHWEPEDDHQDDDDDQG